MSEASRGYRYSQWRAVQIVQLVLGLVKDVNVAEMLSTETLAHKELLMVVLCVHWQLVQQQIMSQNV